MNSRIKVLTMLTSFQIGGTERQVVNVALGLNPASFDLHLACLRNIGELKDEVDGLEIPRPVFDIGRLLSFRTLREAFRFARYVRRNGIQVVHTYGLYSNIFGVPVAKLAGVPIVIASIRDRGDILKPWQRWLQRVVCRLADCVLVNAEAIRETLIVQGYAAKKIAVIRNGIVQRNIPKPETPSDVRKELGIAPSAPLVMVFSRLNPMKGLEYFLGAARIVAAKLPETRFLIVGDGAIRTELQEHSEGLGLKDKVVFTGFRTDVTQLLAEVNVSVLPSLSEGLSNTLLESMAAGIPVVATHVGGNPEIVENGVSGLLVPPRDSAMLADAILKVLEDQDLRAAFAEAGKRRIAELFSMERSVREVEALYQTLVEVPRRSWQEVTAL